MRNISNFKVVFKLLLLKSSLSYPLILCLLPSFLNFILRSDGFSTLYYHVPCIVFIFLNTDVMSLYSLIRMSWDPYEMTSTSHFSKSSINIFYFSKSCSRVRDSSLGHKSMLIRFPLLTILLVPLLSIVKIKGEEVKNWLKKEKVETNNHEIYSPTRNFSFSIDNASDTTSFLPSE